MAYDATAAAAARREALGERFTFSWHGGEFTIDPPDEWPAEAVEVLGEGKAHAALMLIIDSSGDGQAAALRKKPRLRQGDVEGLLDALAEFYGIGANAGE